MGLTSTPLSPERTVGAAGGLGGALRPPSLSWAEPHPTLVARFCPLGQAHSWEGCGIAVGLSADRAAEPNGQRDPWIILALSHMSLDVD